MPGSSVLHRAPVVAGRIVAAAAFFMLACGREQTPQKAEAPSPPVAAPAESAMTSSSVPTEGSGCPAYGLWRACSVEERIGRAGLAVTRRDEGIKHDFMSVEGMVWETSRSEIQVFLYPSEAERRRDTDGLDTVMVAPRGKRIIWRAPATLVTSQNLAAIILSPNPRQAERIALALGAGLPAPPR